MHSDRRHRYDVPRQGTLSDDHVAKLCLDPGCNYEQALADLDGIERIWLIYVFHLNTGWKPRVHVPRHRDDKVGVFATRAPYRPNPIGISCVRLLHIDGLTLHVAECDLLDGTPVLDIKPYLPYADSFPEALTGWIPSSEDLYEVQYSGRAAAQMEWLRNSGVDISSFVRTQLEAAPRDGTRKRVQPVIDTENLYQLAYRTWRLNYMVDDSARIVRITNIFSGYSLPELGSDSDPYGDKNIHILFNNTQSFPCPER